MSCEACVAAICKQQFYVSTIFVVEEIFSFRIRYSMLLFCFFHELSKIKVMMQIKNCLKLVSSRRKTPFGGAVRILASERFHNHGEKETGNAKQRTVFLGCSTMLALGIGYLSYKIFRSKKIYLSFAVDCMPLSVFGPVVASCDFKDQSHNQESVGPRHTFNFLADVVEKTAPSVVYVEINARHPVTRKNIPVSNGSGFIVKSDGLILTNAHVVSHYGHVVVKLYDGREYEGTVENLDTETDLATVRIKAKDLPELPLGQSSKLRAGEFVIAMGNPLTLSHTITAGVVSSANRQGKEIGLHKKSDYIQTDAAINVGNSGGPLVNLDGEAIGINTMKVTEGISFAIPSDRAIDFLKRTESDRGRWNLFKKTSASGTKRKYLGITMLTLSSTIIEELRERNPLFPDVDHGVLVWRVMLDSPSYEHGIQPGDVITKINDKDIYSASDIYSLLSTEDVLKIHFIRQKKEYDVDVELYDPHTP